jgi:uncharacterized coiled-coil protein SlyX
MKIDFAVNQTECDGARHMSVSVDRDIIGGITLDHQPLCSKALLDSVAAENAALKKQLEFADYSALQERVTRLVAGTETRDRTIARLVASAAAQDKTIAELKEQLEERKNTEASDANDWRRMWDRLTRLTADNCKLLAQHAPLMDCVRWYAARGRWKFASSSRFSEQRLFVPPGVGYAHAETCLRSLGLLDTDERSGEGC